MILWSLFLIFVSVATVAGDTTSHSVDQLSTLLSTIGHRRAIKILGWDPYYTVYTDARSCVQGDACTIFCHGIGQNQEAIPVMQHRNLLAGTVIGFDFEDATYNEKVDYSKTSFGQEHETKALLYLLKYLDEDTEIPAFHLYGYSRGGAVILNAIKQLLCYREHRKMFKRLNISHEQACCILKKIQAGTVVLDCPLLDMRVITKHRAPRHLSVLVDYLVCTCGTHFKYAPWKDQGIKSASYCKPLDLALLVHFQENDRTVTNRCDTAFYDLIKGPRTMLVRGTDENGHQHIGKTLAPALKKFRKKYGGAYCL